MRDWKIVTGQRIKPKACEAVPICKGLVMAHNYRLHVFVFFGMQINDDL